MVGDAVVGEAEPMEESLVEWPALAEDALSALHQDAPCRGQRDVVPGPIDQ